MNERVVIVEDEQIVALDMRAGLESSGYSAVGVFSRGDEVVRELPGLNPDLVLMDINLRGRWDGTETAKEIGRKSSVPVVFVTACGHRDRSCGPNRVAVRVHHQAI